jgi:predicted metal-dependent hydrolase
VDETANGLWTKFVGDAPRRDDLHRRRPRDVYKKICVANSVLIAVYRHRVTDQEPLFGTTGAQGGGVETEAGPAIEVVRSPRRRRTVSAHRVGDRIVVSVPARISRAEETKWVALMVERVLASERKLRPSDDELMTRARELSTTYLDGRAAPSSVRWVDNMTARWGSCTPVDGTIRLSRRLEGMPAYVVDYVLLHELAHLVVPGHGARFWKLLAGFERLERATGYLEAAAAFGPGSTPTP